MADHLVTTKVTGAACPRCRAVVLVGLAEGLTARVDLTPLNSTGEIAALIADRWTYTLTRQGLVHRDAGRIAGGHLTGPILAEHCCGYTPPPAYRTPPSQPTPASEELVPPY